jgi:hypothetical protein
MQVGQPFVIDAKEVQHRGMQIVDGHRIAHGFDIAVGHLGQSAVRVVIAIVAGGLAFGSIFIIHSNDLHGTLQCLTQEFILVVAIDRTPGI